MRLWLAVCLLLPLCGVAQPNRGELRLHVHDSSGSPLAASVSLTSSANGYRQALTCDNSGTAVSGRIPYGLYQVRAEQAGFSPAETTVEVDSAVPQDVELSLQIAQLRTVVRVSGDNTLLDPRSTNSSMQIGEQQIEQRLSSLPGRSVPRAQSSGTDTAFDGCPARIQHRHSWMKPWSVSAYEAGYQELLFGPNAAPETSFDYSFKYDPNVYPAKWFYSGRNRFEKHFYPMVGELESTGEECNCAEALDAQSGIRTWVRNLALQPEASFWLQTKAHRFYPDFVAETLDGRLLVVEYKGDSYVTNDDSKDKKVVGEVWAKGSNGRALFLMAVKKDERGRNVHEQIRGTIEGW